MLALYEGWWWSRTFRDAGNTHHGPLTSVASYKYQDICQYNYQKLNICLHYFREVSGKQARNSSVYNIGRYQQLCLRGVTEILDGWKTDRRIIVLLFNSTPFIVPSRNITGLINGGAYNKRQVSHFIWKESTS